MNTYTFGVSTTQPTVEHTYTTIDLFDQTNFIIDLSNVYCDVFPNYIAFNWGDGSSIEEPELTVYRNYRTDSIYPEVLKGPSPLFLNKGYSHIYYPSNFALNKSLTLRINIEYVTGAVTKLTVPVNIRTEGYHQTVEDMEVVGLDLLDNEMNSSRYTLLTKKDNYLLQVDNTAQKEEQYPDKDKISWDMKRWGEWGPPGKMDNIVASPWGFHKGPGVPWQGWSPWKVDQGVWDRPRFIPPAVPRDLEGPPDLDGIELGDWRAGGKNCEEKILFPRRWKHRLRRNGPWNRRGEVNLKPRGKSPGIVPLPGEGDWESASEADKLMTFPPFYLYLWILVRKGEINYLELQQWERCQYGDDGFQSSDGLFEEGLRPNVATPVD